MPEQPDPAASAVVSALLDRGLTLATGESLTAGLLAATLATVPGCSAVLQGGVVAYQREVKGRLLGIADEVLAAGLVSEPVAVAMARGARTTVGADLGVSTTGVAGPDPHDGEPVGSVWISVSTDETDESRHLALRGSRDEIRCQTVAACFALVLEVLGPPETPLGLGE